MKGGKRKVEIPGDVAAKKGESEEVMSPEMIRKIDAVLEKIKDPESGLPVAQLGLVRRVRYSEKDKRFYIFTDAYRHLPHCVTCAAIAQTIIATIVRDVTAEFQKEFPDLTVEFV
jgi:metal-sulfur cluster biosynthetic enzyme